MIESKTNKKKELELQEMETIFKSDLEQTTLFYENMIAKLKQEFDIEENSKNNNGNKKKSKQPKIKNKKFYTSYH